MQKSFIIKCLRCAWSETSTGISADLKHLNEVKTGCPTCGSARRFKCPRCGQIAKMKRFQGNTAPPLPKTPEA